MDPQQAQSLIDHASKQGDRWLFLAMLVLMLFFIAIVIKWLTNQNEKQHLANQDAQKEMHGILTGLVGNCTTALNRCSEVMARVERKLPES